MIVERWRLIYTALIFCILLSISACAGGTIGTGTRPPPGTTMFGDPSLSKGVFQEEITPGSEEVQSDECGKDKRKPHCK